MQIKDNQKFSFGANNKRGILEKQKTSSCLGGGNRGCHPGTLWQWGCQILARDI